MVIARHFVVLMLMLTSGVATATVTLSIAPDPIVAGDSASISFTLVGTVDDEPDFSALETDFEIIGRNRQTSIGWLNARREQTTTWTLSVLARKSGTLTIPAIAFGSTVSAAREVEVIAAPRATPTSGADIILEVEADNHAPYVQQQVIYTIRLLHRVELSSPRFSALEPSADAIVKPLGDGRQYRHQQNGVTYDAFEQRYALYPQQSGPMTIRPLVLTTQIIKRKRAFFDPFSQSLQTRRVESDAIELEVRPIPASFPADATWLPARRLRLYEEWEPDTTSTDVGTPVARTLYLWADGLVAGQLPEIPLVAPGGTKIYPDQAQNSDKDTPTGFTAVMQQKFALIAGKPGQAHFEPIAIPWWNTTTDALETARIEAREIEFKGVAVAPPAADAATPLAPPAAAPQSAPVAIAGAAEPHWRWLSGAFALAWLLTGFAWWRSHARSRSDGDANARQTTPHDASATRDLKSACAANDARGAAAALLAWGRATRSDAGRLRGLHDLAALVVGEALRAQINALDQHCYGRTTQAWDGAPLWQAFRQEPRPERPTDKTPQTALPALFRLAHKQ